MNDFLQEIVSLLTIQVMEELNLSILFCLLTFKREFQDPSLWYPKGGWAKAKASTLSDEPTISKINKWSFQYSNGE